MSRSMLGWVCAAACVAAGCSGGETPPLVNTGAGIGGAGIGGAGIGGAGTGGSGGAGAGGSGGGSPTSAILHTDGNALYDTCGNKLIVRGVEQVFGQGIAVGGSWLSLVDEIGKTGTNAVRLLPNMSQLSVADLDSILGRVTSLGMVFNVTASATGAAYQAWYAQPDVKAVLLKYEPWLMIDAFNEPNYDDPTRWLSDATTAVAALRAAGYRVPLNVISNQYGRDLPTALAHGQEVFDSDPLKNTIIGWQAYWGDSGWYQQQYGMTLAEGVQRTAQAAFPMQIGIDYYSDPGEKMDYATTMQAAQENEVGWLWWDFYNPFGRTNNLSADGTVANLTSFGKVVVSTDANSIQNTAKKVCPPR
jgi:mannan endo-1,4-beta-mannosidase